MLHSTPTAALYCSVSDFDVPTKIPAAHHTPAAQLPRQGKKTASGDLWALVLFFFFAKGALVLCHVQSFVGLGGKTVNLREPVNQAPTCTSTKPSLVLAKLELAASTNLHISCSDRCIAQQCTILQLAVRDQQQLKAPDPLFNLLQVASIDQTLPN